MSRTWWLPLLLVLVVACGGDDESPSPEASQPGGLTATTTATAGATESPAPPKATVGPRAPLQQGAAGRADAFRVELLQVSDPWTDGAPAPGPGERYILIAVTVENRSGEARNISFLNFAFLAGDKQYSGEKVQGLEPYLTPQTVAPGAVVQGFVAAAVPADETVVGVDFDADTSTDAHISFLAGLQ